MRPTPKFNQASPPRQPVSKGLARLREVRALTRPERQPITAELPNVGGGDTSTATIRLYDPIDSWGEFWGISAKEMAAVLDDLPDTVAEIRLLINSPGGEVFDAIAIMNQLRSHDARVVAVVEGMAASAASFIACSADELIMAPNSELMIHNAWGVCVGEAADMQQMADVLNHLSDNVASVYAAKAGGTVEEWRAVMSPEAWYSAEEAVAAGLADRVDGEAPDASGAKARIDLSIFNYAGRAKAPAPQASATPPSPTPTPGKEGVSMPDLTKLRDALGVAEDITDDDLVDWLTAEASQPPPTPPDPPALPEGTVAIDAAVLADLKASAAQGVAAKAKLDADHREGLVLAAIKDGRIAPAGREHWLNLLEKDPTAEATLAGLAPGLIPVAPIGTEAGDLDEDSAFYASIYPEVKV